MVEHLCASCGKPDPLREHACPESVAFDCSPAFSRVLFDCFIIRDGVEYLCEVYEAADGHVEDFAVYPLLDDGSKGEGILEDGFEDEVQQKYYDWINATVDGDVI